ncbi:MAG: hypothetical protein J6N51_12090 [Selenomonas sp.]|nr:hypothetical protein [Selenomonas sp.]
MAEDIEIEIIAVQSLKKWIESRSEFEDGVYLDDDNAELVVKSLDFYLKHLQRNELNE